MDTLFPPPPGGLGPPRAAFKALPCLVPVLQQLIIALLFFLAFGAYSIMQGNNPAAGPAFPFLAIRFLEVFETAGLYDIAVRDQAGLVPCIVALFQIPDALARKLSAFVTMGKSFSMGAFFDGAGPASIRLVVVIAQASTAGLLFLQMNITDKTIHSARSEQTTGNGIRHQHRKLLRL